MPRGPVTAQQKQSYIAKVNELVESTQDRYAQLKTYYGINGRLNPAYGTQFPNNQKYLDEYANIVIEKPENLSEEQALAICVGSIINEKHLNKKELNDNLLLEDAGIVFSVLDNNRTMVVEDANRDVVRTQNYLPGFVQARKDAKTAIDFYAQGRKIGSDSVLKQIVDYALESMEDYGGAGDDVVSKSNIHSNKRMIFLLANHVLETEIYKIPGNKSDKQVMNIMKLKAFAKEIEAYEKAAATRKQILETENPANSPRRKELAEDLVFNALLAELSKATEKNNNAKMEEMLEDFFIRMGIDSKQNGRNSVINQIRDNPATSRSIPFAGIGIRRSLNTYTINDLQVLLSQPDGVETLRNLFKKSIRKSTVYKNLVAAENDNLVEAMMDVDDFAKGKSFYSFHDVKVPDAAKPFNSSLKDDFNNSIKATVRKLESECYGAIRGKDADFEIKAFDDENFKKNVTATNEFITFIDNRSGSRGKGDVYAALQDSLKKLNEQAKVLQQTGEHITYDNYKKYMELVNDSIAKTQNYLDSMPKPKPGSSEADLVKNAGMLKRILNDNRISFEDTYKKLFTEDERSLQEEGASARMAKARNDASLVYDPAHTGNNNPYLKGRWKDQNIHFTSEYSTDRTAIYSITVMSLAAKNKNGNVYSLEDLADLNKFEVEKSAAFDETADHIKGKTPEDQKWIAQNIYDGINVMSRLLREKAETLDFTDPKTYHTKEYYLYKQMAFATFDAWQELSHCMPEIVAIVHKDHPEIDNYEQAKLYLSFLTEADTCLQGRTIKKNEYLQAYADKKYAAFQNIVNDAIAERIYGDYYALAIKNGIPTKDIYNKRTLELFQNYAITFAVGRYPDITDINRHPEICSEVVRMVSDGTFLQQCKISYDLDNPDETKCIKVTGIPTAKDIMAEKEFRSIPQSMRADSVLGNTTRLSRMMNAVKEENRHYLTRAGSAYMELHDIIEEKRVINEETKQKALDCIRDIVRAELLQSFEKTGLRGESLQNAIDKTITDMKLLPSIEGYFSHANIGQYTYTGYVADLVKSKQAQIDNLVSENLYMKNYQDLAKADQKRDKDIRESVHKGIADGLAGVSAVMHGISGVSRQDSNLEALKEKDDDSLYARVFNEEYNGDDMHDFYHSTKPQPIKNINEYNKYIAKVKEYTAELESVLENELSEGRATDKEVEFVKSLGINSVKRSLRGANVELMATRTPLARSFETVKPMLVSQMSEGLGDKIKKMGDKCPIYDVFIEADKQLDTLADYWLEKGDGVLSEERENVYRNRLYDQTVNSLALVSKFENAVYDLQMNAAIKEAMIFNPANDPFEAHSASERGLTLYTASLEAYKAGLENGWAIDDLGALASFNIIVQHMRYEANCNRNIKRDSFELYNEARFYSDEKRDLYERMSALNDEIQHTPIADSAMRRSYLEKMTALVNEGMEKNYVGQLLGDSFKQEMSFAGRNTRKIELAETQAVHSKVTAEVLGKEARKSDWSYRKTKLNSALAKFNAKRTDGYPSSESDMHKGVRVAAELLMEELTQKATLENGDGPEISKDERMKNAARSIGRLDEVIYLSKNYQKERASSSSTGGKDRLEGARELESFAKSERVKILNDLQKDGITVNVDTVNKLRLNFASEKMVDAVSKIEIIADMPTDPQGKEEIMDAAADIMVYKFAVSTVDANKDAFNSMGINRLKDQIKEDGDFKKLIRNYFKDRTMTPSKMVQELMGSEALNKMNTLNRKYASESREKKQEIAKKQEARMNRQ